MELSYLVREPEHITSETPILFMLHGYGSNEEDLFSFRDTLPQDWLIVSFRAPLNTPYEGYSWYDINFNNPDEFINPDQAKDAMNAILKYIVEIKQRYGLNAGNTHLAGFSQGGILTYALSLTNPQLFHKVICMSCYPEEKILTNIVKDKKKLEHLRFFVSHGTDDAVIPLDWARKGAELLYNLSCYFTFREYMSGHGVNQKNYMDLMDFLNK